MVRVGFRKDAKDMKNARGRFLETLIRINPRAGESAGKVRSRFLKKTPSMEN